MIHVNHRFIVQDTHNNKLQRRMPYMCISPHWCSICKKNSKSQSHIFISCEFTISNWEILLSSFGWSTTFPKILLFSFHMFFFGHPFKKEKKLILLIWQERNHQIFCGKELPMDRFFDCVVFLAITE